MCTFARPLARFLKAEDGPTAVEYAVMLAPILVVRLAAITNLGQCTNDSFRTTRAKRKAAAS